MVDTVNLEMVTCPKCGRFFPKKRKELGYNYCCNCSTEQNKVGMIEDVGSGDHCYTSVTLMSPVDAFEINKAQAKFRGTRVVASFEEPELNINSFEEEEELDNSKRLTEREAQLEEIEVTEGFSETTAEEMCRIAKEAVTAGIEGLFEDEKEEDFEESDIEEDE